MNMHYHLTCSWMLLHLSCTIVFDVWVMLIFIKVALFFEILFSNYSFLMVSEQKIRYFPYIVSVVQPYDNVHMKKWNVCVSIQIISINVSFFAWHILHAPIHTKWNIYINTIKSHNYKRYTYRKAPKKHIYKWHVFHAFPL